MAGAGRPVGDVRRRTRPVEGGRPGDRPLQQSTAGDLRVGLLFLVWELRKTRV